MNDNLYARWCRLEESAYKLMCVDSRQAGASARWALISKQLSRYAYLHGMMNEKGMREYERIQAQKRRERSE